ncbi:MAG: type II toxin-antitoxin system death-on-curing family toxin [Blastocatellia bacterium]
METEETRYLTYVEAVVIHIDLMESVNEVRFGVFDRDLIESALARPRQAAVYENADILRQAATLCFGLIKSHPWTGGNKRTATALTFIFLRLNGWRLYATMDERIELVLGIEAGRYDIDNIETWLRQHARSETPLS